MLVATQLGLVARADNAKRDIFIWAVTPVAELKLDEAVVQGNVDTRQRLDAFIQSHLEPPWIALQVAVLKVSKHVASRAGLEFSETSIDFHNLCVTWLEPMGRRCRCFSPTLNGEPSQSGLFVSNFLFDFLNAFMQAIYQDLRFVAVGIDQVHSKLGIRDMVVGDIVIQREADIVEQLEL